MATEDFTTWTEADPQSRLTVTSSSITINDLERDDAGTWVYNDFGAGYWSGDWSIRFKYTTPASGESDVGCWIYPLGFYNTLNEPGDIETGGGDFQSLIFSVGSGPVAYLYLDVVEDGVRNYAIPDPISFETTYYVTLERDDDGGANGTGQLTLRLYTTNYYGESGAVEHDTVTQDCGVGEQNDFRYIMLAAPRGASTETTDGLIEDLDLAAGATTYVELAGTPSLTFSSTAELAGFVSLAGSSPITFSSSGILTFGPLSSAKVERVTRYLVMFGNDSATYESS